MPDLKLWMFTDQTRAFFDLQHYAQMSVNGHISLIMSFRLQTVVYAVKHLQENDGLYNNGFFLLRALQFDLTLL